MGDVSADSAQSVVLAHRQLSCLRAATIRSGGTLHEEPRLAHRFARNLKAARLRAQMTQVGLAQAAGIDRKTLNRLEQGKHAASLENVEALSRVLEVPIIELLGLQSAGAMSASAGMEVDRALVDIAALSSGDPEWIKELGLEAGDGEGTQGQPGALLAAIHERSYAAQRALVEASSSHPEMQELLQGERMPRPAD